MTYHYDEMIKDGLVDSRVYSDSQVFEDELERIFYGGWVFMAHESEIPQRGDYVRRNIGLEPWVVVRLPDGGVRVLSNRCTHRGTLLLQPEKGNVRATITCWYHGWVFGLDGSLKAVPYPVGSKSLEHKSLPIARVGNYRGFIFATVNPDAEDFDDYLGRGKELIDRAVEASPVGKVRLDAGWVKFYYKTNWKLQAENNIDGYHLNYVHASLGRAIDSRYVEATMVGETRLKTLTRDWGKGHSELELGPGFENDLEWLGYTGTKKMPPPIEAYRQQLRDAYEPAIAERMIHDGPPHAFIFPNLFLAETNVVFYQMSDAGQCIQLHTPMLLEGVADEVNTRILRLCEAALGPTSFFLPDDGVITERQQQSFAGRPINVDLRRGIGREEINANGVLESHITDETTNRAFWNHYRDVMAKPGGRSAAPSPNAPSTPERVAAE